MSEERSFDTVQIEFPERRPLEALRPYWEWFAEPLHFFLTLCSLVPLVVLIVMVHRQSANIPSWDQWAVDVPLAINVKDGEFHLRDLFVQRNEHRNFFTELLTLLLTLTTNWNIVAGLYVYIGVACLSWLMIVSLFWRHEPKMVAFVMPPFAALIFSVRQHFNWLGGYQFGWHMVIFLLLLALLSLKSIAPGWRSLGIAALCALCATFATSQGILLWFVLPISLWCLGYRRWLYYAVWVCAAVVSLGLFYWGYNFDVMGADTSGQSAGLVKNPIVLARYVLTFLGNSFVPQNAKYGLLALTIGALGLFLLLLNLLYLWYREHDLRLLGVWLSLVAFAGGVAFIIALGRAHIFPENQIQPLLDRYSTYGGLMWLAWVAVMVMTLRRLLQQNSRIKLESGMVYANLAMCVVLIALYIFSNDSLANTLPVASPLEKQCVKDFPLSRNFFCLNRVFVKDTPLVDVVNGIDKLAVRRLTIFNDADFPHLQGLVALRNLEGRPIGEQFRTGFEFAQLAQGYQTFVLFQHPDSSVEYTLQLPVTDQQILFRSAAWVDTSHLNATDIPEAQDGATFRVIVRDAAGQEQALFEQAIDPNQESAPHLVQVDLSQYRGQRITLILQTDKRANPYYDWAMWMDPIVLIFSE